MGRGGGGEEGNELVVLLPQTRVVPAEGQN